jgi:hypothetical protein
VKDWNIAYPCVIQMTSRLSTASTCAGMERLDTDRCEQSHGWQVNLGAKNAGRLWDAGIIAPFTCKEADDSERKIYMKNITFLTTLVIAIIVMEKTFATVTYKTWTNHIILSELSMVEEQKTFSYSFIDESSQLTLAGDFGYNIQTALHANNGHLQQFTIRPGETWSFNAAIGDPDALSLRIVNNVSGGGWCNLANRYVEAAYPFLPPHAIRFSRHSPTSEADRLNVTDANPVAIWNIDGRPGSGEGRLDLEIENVTPYPLHFEVVTISRHPHRIVVRLSQTVPNDRRTLSYSPLAIAGDG